MITSGSTDCCMSSCLCFHCLSTIVRSIILQRPPLQQTFCIAQWASEMTLGEGNWLLCSIYCWLLLNYENETTLLITHSHTHTHTHTRAHVCKHQLDGHFLDETGLAGYLVILEGVWCKLFVQSCALSDTSQDDSLLNFMLTDSLWKGCHVLYISWGVCQYIHTHNRFTALLEYVRDHPGEQVPER